MFSVLFDLFFMLQHYVFYRWVSCGELKRLPMKFTTKPNTPLRNAAPHEELVNDDDQQRELQQEEEDDGLSQTSSQLSQ